MNTRWWQQLIGRLCRPKFRQRQPQVYRLPRLERLEERLAPSHDTIFTALPLSFASRPVAQVSAMIATPNQVDLYAVTLHAGDQLTADVNAQRQGSQLQAAVRLFDAGGHELAVNVGGSGQDPLLTYTTPAVPSTNIYYVGVSSFDNLSYDPTASGSGSGGTTTGIYALMLTDLAAHFAAADSIVFDPNTGVGQVPPPETLAPGGVKDYRVTVADTELLVGTVAAVGSPGFVPRLTLFDGTGQLLIQSDQQGGGMAGATVDQHLQPGTYYLEVSAAPTGSSLANPQDYQLTTTLMSSLPPLADLPVGRKPHSVAVGDFNGDGRPDLVTANFGFPLANTGNTVTVLLGNGDGSFTPDPFHSPGLPPGTFVVGSAPSSVAVADVNGDGRLDIVTANFFSNTVNVLLGNGDGSFTPDPIPPPRLPPGPGLRGGSYPNSVAVADVNGDGRPDLVTANLVANTVSVLLQNPDGSFQAARTYAVGSRPQSVAVADVNGDGKPDLVTANSRDNTVSVLLGNGDGSFQAARSFAVGSYPNSVAVADVNGDGRPDLVTTNFYAATVSVLLGNGDGSFQPARSVAVGSSPLSVAAADVNGDGRTDLVTANELDNTVSVLLGNGDGSFQPARSVAVGSVPFSVAVADVNGDDRPDLVTANLTTLDPTNLASGDVSVLLGNGDGSFQAATLFTVGSLPGSVAVAKLRGKDQPYDLVTANSGAGTVSVLLGNGDGSFQAARSIEVGGRPGSVAVADVNGDGRPDLAVTANGTVNVLLGNGDGSFQAARSFDVGGAPTFVAVAYVNGDGIPDLVTANEFDNTVSVLLGNGDGSFQPARTYSVGSYFPDFVAVADVNGDGRPDLVTANLGGSIYGGSVSVLLDNGDGSFQAARSFAVGNRPNSVAVADVNGDGRPDLVIANGRTDDVSDTSANTVSVLVGDGKGNFTPDPFYSPGETPGIFTVGNRPVFVAVADVNGDGRPDLVAANEDSNDVSVLLGNGDGSFQAARTFPVGIEPSSVAITDVNGDGRPDLVTANYGSDDVSVLLNQGLGQFQPSQGQSSIPSRDVPQLLDLTGDGILDALSLDQRTGQILFRQGTGDPNNPFDPFVVVNPGQPATDFTLVQTQGAPEIAALDPSAQQVFLYAWSSTTQQFEPIGSFATGPDPVRLASADLDGNGLGDLVVGNDRDNTLTIALQQSPAAFYTFTRSIGAGPSSISFADLNGDGLPDIVVSDLVSGDVSILFNDATPTSAPTFTTQSRYRATRGLFDTNSGPNGTTIVSQLQTVGAVAGDFTGDGNTDLVALNANTHSFTLLRGAGAGSLVDPQLADTYRTAPGAIQVLAGDFRHDGKQDLAILTVAPDGTSQIWVYPNLGSGVFGPPLESDAGQGATGFTFVPGANGQPDHFLIGNANGDFLTLTADVTRPVDFVTQTVNRTQPGHFHIERGNLDGKPLAVGKTSDGRQFVVVADQNQDLVQVYFRIPGTGQFAAPVPIDSHTQALLAPGAVQLIDLTNGTADLVVASRLGNDILVYPGLPDGSFGPPTSIPVGFEPVAVTAAFMKGNNVLDLAVANQGSNDISILRGSIDPKTGLWTATPGPRLNSGSEPIAVQVGNFMNNGLADLRVTNRGGQVATIPGIGSNGQSTGFFNDTRLLTTSLGSTITQAVFDPRTGQEFLVSGGGIFTFNGASFTSVFTATANLNVATLGTAAGFLVAGFEDGSVGVLTESGSLLEREAGFADQPSALQALQEGNSLDVFATYRGTDVPVFLAFFIPSVEVSNGAAVAEASTVPGSDLLLVATLLSGGLTDQIQDNGPGQSPGDEVFALFLPPQVRGSAAADQAGGDDSELVVWVDAQPDSGEGPAWQSYRLGVDEALPRSLDQQRGDQDQDELEFFQQRNEMSQGLYEPLHALPQLPEASQASRGSPLLPTRAEEPDRMPKVSEETAEDRAPAPTDAMDQRVEVFADSEWLLLWQERSLSRTALPSRPDGSGEPSYGTHLLAQVIPDSGTAWWPAGTCERRLTSLGPALLAAWLARPAEPRCHWQTKKDQERASQTSAPSAGE